MTDESLPVSNYPSARERLERCMTLLGDSDTYDELFVNLLQATLPEECIDLESPKEQTRKLAELLRYGGQIAVCATCVMDCAGQRLAFYKRESMDDFGNRSKVFDLLLLCPTESEVCKNVSVDLSSIRRK